MCVYYSTVTLVQFKKQRNTRRICCHILIFLVTLMRTTIQENKEAAQFIGRKLNCSVSPVRVLLPEKGVSALDCFGKPFHDKDATNALIEELENCIEQNSHRRVTKLPYNINDPEFADALTEAFLEIFPSELMPGRPSRSDSFIPKEMAKCNHEVIEIPPISSAAKPETFRLRELVLERLRRQIASGIPIIGAGAGTGISAKFEEEGGADLIVIYNSGRFRMAGRGSCQGLCPTKMQMQLCWKWQMKLYRSMCIRSLQFLKELEDIGFTESAAMAQAGADIIVAHMGLTTSGSIGTKTALSLKDSANIIQEIAEAAHNINPDVIILCHGGPISGPREAAFIVHKTSGVHGFYGASCMERLPEIAC